MNRSEGHSEREANASSEGKTVNGQEGIDCGEERAPGRRRRDDHDPYRERILDAARILFQEHGLDGVSMYQIAKKAGMGQGSLYRRYADKGEICSDLLQNNMKRLFAGIEDKVAKLNENPASASLVPGGTAAMDCLLTMIRQIIHFIDEHAEILLMIKSEFTGKKQLTQFEHPLFLRLNKILTDLLEQAVRNGEILGIDPQFMGSALIAMLSPDLYLFRQKYHGAAKEDNLGGIFRILTALRK